MDLARTLTEQALAEARLAREAGFDLALVSLAALAAAGLPATGS